MPGPEWWVSGGLLSMLVTVLGLGLKAILNGKLVPWIWVDKILQQNDKLNAALEKAYDQNQKLLDSLTVVNEVLAALPMPEETRQKLRQLAKESPEPRRNRSERR